MEFLETFGSYESYLERERAVSQDGTKVLTDYSDYRSGTFGSLVMDPPASFPEDEAEKAAVVQSMRESAKAIVFYKFGSPLVCEEKVLPSLSLLLEEASVPGRVAFVPRDGIPVLMDYSGAPRGSCVAYTVARASIMSADKSTWFAVVSRFAGQDWRHVLGYSETPPPHPRARSVSGRLV